VIRVFAALKWRLLLNAWFRTRLGILAFVGAVLGFGLAGLGALGAASVARNPESALAFRAAGLGTYTVVFALWVFGPLLVGVDETVDSTRLALVPLTRRDLRNGLVTASLLGFGPIASGIVLLGVLLGFMTDGFAGVLVVAAVVVGFVMGLTASRALATVLARAQRSRRGRDITVIAGALTGAAIWFATQIAPHLHSSSERRLFDVLRWTPPGLIGQAIVDASSGRLGVAALGIAGGLAWCALFGWAWIDGVTRLLVDTGASTRRDDAHVESGAPLLRGGVTRASIGKELRYLVRSPARRSATLVAAVLGIGFVLLQVLQRAGAPAAGSVLAAPAAGFFAVSSINNQLGHDGASLWLEVVAGGPRRESFVGRAVSWLPAMIVPAIVAAVVLAALSGGWRFVPFAIALAFATAGVPLGVGSVISSIAPIAVPDDANPFTNRSANTGQGCLVGLAAIGALLTNALLLTPVIVAVVMQHDHLTKLAVAVAIAAVYGFVVWNAGVAVALRRVRGREPELVSVLAPRT
jgi:ABC-2 type transport system permease protein